MHTDPSRRGESAVGLIWTGVIMSQITSTITDFGLALYVFEKTGSLGAMTALAIAALAPRIYIGVFAGVLVDRAGPKVTLVLAALAGAATAAVLGVALATGALQTWLAVLAVAASSIAAGMRDVALKTVVPAFVESSRLPTVNGWIGSAQTFPYVAGPGIAAGLLSVASLPALVLVDAVVLALAAAVIAWVRFPPRPTAASAAQMPRLTEGWSWIAERPALFWLSAFFGVFLFISGASVGLLTPYILASSGGDKVVLAAVQTMVAIGGLASGLVVGRVIQRLGSLRTIALCCASMALSRVWFGMSAGPAGWGMANFVRGAGFIGAGAADDTLWHRLVPEGWRGRVFGGRRMLTHGLYPLGIAIGGVLGSALADSDAANLGRVFVLFGVAELVALLILLRVRSSGYGRLAAEAEQQPVT